VSFEPLSQGGFRATRKADFFDQVTRGLDRFPEIQGPKKDDIRFGKSARTSGQVIRNLVHELLQDAVKGLAIFSVRLHVHTAYQKVQLCWKLDVTLNNRRWRDA
jgi:hypothetical protein